MAVDSTLVVLLQQLAAQAPTLLVYILGMVLALVFWRRYPRPCLLTLLAFILLLLTALGQTFLQGYLIQARLNQGWAAGDLSWMLSILAITANVFRAAGMGLLLAAVFVGREPPRLSEPRRVASGWDDTTPISPPPEAESARDPGIKTRLD